MTERLTAWLAGRLGWPQERVRRYLERVAVGIAALFFAASTTLIVVYDDLFFTGRGIASLRVGEVAPVNINAPQSLTFVSEVLTNDALAAVANAVQPVYDPPDPNITRQQTQLAQQILAFIRDVREDIYGTFDQRMNDLNAITALNLPTEIRRRILEFSDENWESIASEVLTTLSFAMRESIREADLPRVRAQLGNQVSVRFNEEERAAIVALVVDLIRPNTFLNSAATEAARAEAQAQVVPITRTVIRGERILSEGDLISPLAYEALDALGLLTPTELDARVIVSGLIVVLLVMALVGLYLAEYSPLLLYRRVRMLALLGNVFILTLLAVRLLALDGYQTVFPYALLALLFVAIVGTHEALIGTLALGILSGYMADGSLEVAALVIVGGWVGALTLRNTQRLNAFFISGAVVAVVNMAILIVFRFGVSDGIARGDLIGSLALAFLSGVVLLPAITIALMFVLTQLFNLPTALRLLDLSQPNKPILQRMLREAAGTYQHSLQVANLAEQAAQRIGADAQLVRVAALYHDIGKMENPLFFTENQPDPSLNPHNKLNDPYRSAAIIIEHVTKGEEMARTAGLPRRLRDFILEHHGTTRVSYFYRVALDRANGDASQVDSSAFEYPGPRPRSRETALLMLADTCEATIRSIQPKTRAEIARIVKELFDAKREGGQLDDSGLTLTDLALTQAVFIEIFQGMYHHRIKYQEDNKTTGSLPAVVVSEAPAERRATDEVPAARRSVEVNVVRPATVDEDEPLDEVPRLPRAETRTSSKTSLPPPTPTE
ncbi:MAG: HDIG domain-containing metalloprotein [Anaerolineae bacterium]